MQNIIFHGSHVELTLDQSKTDIYRRGNIVVIAKTGNDLCPVTWLKKYVQLADLNSNPEFFIFRSRCFFKLQKMYKLNKNNCPLSYARAREILLKALDDIGFDKSRFCLHSLRSEEASTAANKGVSERLLKAYGRSSSDRAKDGYIKDNLRSQMLVSLNLGI